MTRVFEAHGRLISLIKTYRAVLVCCFLFGTIISAVFIPLRLSYQRNNFPVMMRIEFADYSQQADQQSSVHSRRNAISMVYRALLGGTILQQASSSTGLSVETLERNIKSWTESGGDDLVVIVSNINGGDTKFVLKKILGDMKTYVCNCKKDGLIRSSLSLKVVVAPTAWQYELIQKWENSSMAVAYVLLSGVLFVMIGIFLVVSCDVYRKGRSE